MCINQTKEKEIYYPQDRCGLFVHSKNTNNERKNYKNKENPNTIK